MTEFLTVFKGCNAIIHNIEKSSRQERVIVPHCQYHTEDVHVQPFPDNRTDLVKTELENSNKDMLLHCCSLIDRYF